DRLQLGDNGERAILIDPAPQPQPRAGDELRTVELGHRMQRLDALEQLYSSFGIVVRRRRRTVHPDVEENSARRQARLRRGRSRSHDHRPAAPTPAHRSRSSSVATDAARARPAAARGLRAASQPLIRGLVRTSAAYLILREPIPRLDSQHNIVARFRTTSHRRQIARDCRHWTLLYGEVTYWKLDVGDRRPHAQME